MKAASAFWEGRRVSDVMWWNWMSVSQATEAGEGHGWRGAAWRGGLWVLINTHTHTHTHTPAKTETGNSYMHMRTYTHIHTNIQCAVVRVCVCCRNVWGGLNTLVRRQSSCGSRGLDWAWMILSPSKWLDEGLLERYTCRMLKLVYLVCTCIRINLDGLYVL